MQEASAPARVAALDGLRGLALVAILAFHANPRWLPEAPRFLASRYLLHASRAEVAQMFARLHPVMEENPGSQCLACLNTS